MKYEDVESEFLEDSASRFGFEGNTRTAFLKRFSEKDAEMDNTNLSIAYETELTLNTCERREEKNNQKKPDAYIILRDRLKVICNKLEEEGCLYDGETKGKWKIAKAWLREKIFPEWVKRQQKLSNPTNLWQELWDRVTSTSGISIKDLSKPDTLAINPAAWGGKKEEIPRFSSRESKLIYEINIERSGYLILLEKSSEQLYCFSPSFLVKNFFHPAGINIFPYKDNPSQLTYIPLEEGIGGREEIVAIVSKNQPNLSWLQSETKPPLELEESHLGELLNFLDKEQEVEIMGAKYLIIA